ncbi:MAG: hypothetical protein R2939_21610 [Kofleriaceae bacterium]
MKTITTLAAAAALLVASTGLASADELSSPGLTAPTRSDAVNTDDRYSEDTATALAIAGTALPLALFAGAGIVDELDASDAAGPMVVAGLGALVLTPSAGHWYAGKVVTPGLVARAAGLGAFAYGVSQICLYDCGDRSNNAGGPMLLGAAAVLGGVIYDLATADAAARDGNARARRLQLAPTVTRSGGATTGGLAVSGAF